jgi:hypothetical protein
MNEMMTTPLYPNRAARMLPSTQTAAWTKPNGMLSRIVCLASNPKPFMMSGPLPVSQLSTQKSA